ncbi:ribokinase [Paenibacillus pectinilyticus]|uniref:Ribokinase n=1 Tax=Paenibacillus pectinilyticus TaxID=512399 RepID=A0A1C1A3K4_9BACL|nr:ribokinase [Paenibacillus pectinilyticus]OCT15125.1 ribokinase [Paenibacillus pectinilyticus]
MKSIYVIGSINMDIINELEQFPLPGQTVEGLQTHYQPGGKGANQAVAAAKAGSQVHMVGAIGYDAFKAPLLASLQNNGVGTTYVLPKECGSGLAFITVNREGENTIILSPGANNQLTLQDLPSQLWQEAALILLQNEIPWDLTETIIQSANQHGIPVWMNPAPALVLPAELYASIHTLILNETEAEQLTMQSISNEADAVLAASQLLRNGTHRVILTLGSKGLLYGKETGQLLHFPAYPVLPVDTTAAGDTFIGAFASAWLRGLSYPEGIKFASAAAAIAVTRFGAQSSVPTEGEIDAFMRNHTALNPRFLKKIYL